MFVHVSLASAAPLQAVAPRLFYGDLQAVHRAATAESAVVHACKEPCHKQAAHYSKSLPPTHPEYLCAQRPQHLYLNMIDPPLPLFKRELFEAFFAFVDQHIAQRDVLIHCNQGRSRAPSLALLYMAKRLHLLPNESYDRARAEFQRQFPYAPGAGIALFLSENWDALGG